MDPHFARANSPPRLHAASAAVRLKRLEVELDYARLAVRQAELAIEEHHEGERARAGEDGSAFVGAPPMDRVLATVAVPAGALGPNGALDVSAMTSRNPEHVSDAPYLNRLGLEGEH